ncbi:hypothetical protein A4U98_07770 [Bifidobacterium animalis subsp. animalis]|nr:hypothetical protein A4U98_07770 [Bifidobacterium animalis subsp. animalis]
MIYPCSGSSICNLQSSICIKRDVYVRDLSLFTQMFALLMRLMQLMMRNDPSAYQETDCMDTCLLVRRVGQRGAPDYLYWSHD